MSSFCVFWWNMHTGFPSLLHCLSPQPKNHYPIAPQGSTPPLRPPFQSPPPTLTLLPHSLTLRPATLCSCSFWQKEKGTRQSSHGLFTLTTTRLTLEAHARHSSWPSLGLKGQSGSTQAALWTLLVSTFHPHNTHHHPTVPYWVIFLERCFRALKEESIITLFIQWKIGKNWIHTTLHLSQISQDTSGAQIMLL